MALEENNNPAKQREEGFLSLDELMKYLPLGYLYLLLLGIASDSIFYGILGINIISYSNVLDVLLSPVALITGSLFLPVAIICILIFGYFYVKFMLKLQQKRRKPDAKPGYFEGMPFYKQLLSFTAFSIFCAFIGIGYS